MRIRLKPFGVSGSFVEIQRKWLCFWIPIRAYNVDQQRWKLWTFGRYHEMRTLGEKLKDDAKFAEHIDSQIQLACDNAEARKAFRAKLKQPSEIIEL